MFANHILASKNPLLLLALFGALALLAGCSDDDPTDVSDRQPQAEVAASLAAPSQTVAAVGENLARIDQFANPLTSLASDVGLSGDPDLEGWTGGGMSFPDQSAVLAANLRALGDLEARSARLAAAKKLPRELAIAMEKDLAVEYADGDTLAVEYFDTPDSTGVNALVFVTAPEMVKYVVHREYPRRLGHRVRLEQSILIDTQATYDNDADDEYHSATFEVEMFGGEITTASLVPVSGTGPMGEGVEVLARTRVDNPRWNILQAWHEAAIVMDPGDFRTEGDEQIYSFEVTVHWLNDAEYNAELATVAGGPIEPDSRVRALGFLSAAPADRWLESIADTLVVELGDLELEDDDLLVEMSRGAQFDGTAIDGGHPRHYVRFVPEEPVSPGDEPCGGVAVQDAWYPSDWWLVHLQRDADIDCDGSGVLHELQELRDGSSFERTITWDGNGGATVSENRPDGTEVTGTFDESTGDYSIDTVFADDNDPVSRSQYGTATDNSIEAWDVFVWQDARADSTHFAAEETAAGTTVSGTKVHGELSESFSVTVTADANGQETIAGTWSRSDGASGEFTVEDLDGGSSHLTYTASDPGAAGSPSVTGDIWTAPDGSGTGTIVFTQYGNTVTYEITFGPTGEGTLEGGGEVVTL